MTEILEVIKQNFNTSVQAFRTFIGENSVYKLP